jgi:hypothetical protein
MNKVGKVLLVFLVIILIIFLLAFCYPALSTKYVKNELSKFNYCDVKGDCARVLGKCPIGNVYVNKKEVAKTENLMKLVPAICVYSRTFINDSLKDCIYGKCIQQYNNADDLV